MLTFCADLKSSLFIAISILKQSAWATRESKCILFGVVDCVNLLLMAK